MKLTYTTRKVFVNPDPDFHPVTITMGSPLLMNPRDFPNLIPNWTRASTSFIQSS